MTWLWLNLSSLFFFDSIVHGKCDISGHAVGLNIFWMNQLIKYKKKYIHTVFFFVFVFVFLFCCFTINNLPFSLDRDNLLYLVS